MSSACRAVAASTQEPRRAAGRFSGAALTSPTAIVFGVLQLEVTQSQDYARVFLPGGGARIGAGLDRITIGGEDVETVFEGLSEESQTVYERDIEPNL